MFDNATPDNDQKAIDIVESTCSLDKSKRIASFALLESMMLEHDQVDIPVVHRFCGDMYAREIIIPKDTLLTGRIHKFDHFDIMLSGDVTVSTDNGEVKRLTGLNILEGKAGKKRAGYTHEDTHWITIHSAQEQDPENMLDFLTVESFDDLDNFNLELNKCDYQSMVASIGMTEEEIQEQVQDVNDQVDFPDGYEYLKIIPSKIHGKGLFSNIDFNEGDVIAPSRIQGFRTPAGRYANHAFFPNAEMRVNENGDADLVALKYIDPREEITVNYRNVIQHRDIKGDLCQA